MDELATQRGTARAREIARLRQAIRMIYGVESSHLRCEPVREECAGTTFQGTVDVFALEGHARARVAYTWSHATGDDGPQYTAVLGIAPIASAQDAVRRSLAGGGRKAPS
jgi:hypothetical protein